VLRAGWFQKGFPVGTWREGEALVNEMDWGGVAVDYWGMFLGLSVSPRSNI